MWKFCERCRRRGPQLPHRSSSVVWGVLGYILAELYLLIVAWAVSGSGGIVLFLGAAGGSVAGGHEPSERRRSPCEQVQRHAARAE
jgi:hypothetical protein